MSAFADVARMIGRWVDGRFYWFIRPVVSAPLGPVVPVVLKEASTNA